MWDTFFGFKKTPFPDNPDSKQLFASQAWNQLKGALAISDRLSRCRSAHGRSGQRQVDSSAHLHRRTQS